MEKEQIQKDLQLSYYDIEYDPVEESLFGSNEGSMSRLYTSDDKMLHVESTKFLKSKDSASREQSSFQETANRDNLYARFLAAEGYTVDTAGLSVKATKGNVAILTNIRIDHARSKVFELMNNNLADSVELGVKAEGKEDESAYTRIVFKSDITSRLTLCWDASNSQLGLFINGVKDQSVKIPTVGYFYIRPRNCGSTFTLNPFRIFYPCLCYDTNFSFVIAEITEDMQKNQQLLDTLSTFDLYIVNPILSEDRRFLAAYCNKESVEFVKTQKLVLTTFYFENYQSLIEKENVPEEVLKFAEQNKEFFNKEKLETLLDTYIPTKGSTADKSRVKFSEDKFSSDYKKTKVRYIKATDSLLLSDATGVKLLKRVQGSFVVPENIFDDTVLAKDQKISIRIRTTEAQVILQALKRLKIEFDYLVQRVKAEIFVFLKFLVDSLKAEKTTEYLLYSTNYEHMKAIIDNLLHMTVRKTDLNGRKNIFERMSVYKKMNMAPTDSGNNEENYAAMNLLFGKEEEESTPIQEVKESPKEDAYNFDTQNVYAVRILLHLQEQLKANAVYLKQADNTNLGRSFSTNSRLTSYALSKYRGRDFLELAKSGLYNNYSSYSSNTHFLMEERPISGLDLPEFNQSSVAEVLLANQVDNRDNLSLANIPLHVFVNSLPTVRFSQNIQSIEVDHASGKVSVLLTDATLYVYDSSVGLVLNYEGNFKESLEKTETQGSLIGKKSQALSNINSSINPKVFDAIADQKKEQAEENPENIIPDPLKLDKLYQMGFPLELARKALIKTRNQSIEAAIEQVILLQDEDLGKGEDNQPLSLAVSLIKPQWDCEVCTLTNYTSEMEDKDTCSACYSPAPQIAYYTKAEIEKMEEELNKQMVAQIEKEQKKLLESKVQEEVQPTDKVPQPIKNSTVASVSVTSLSQNYLSRVLVSAGLNDGTSGIFRVRRIGYAFDYLKKLMKVDTENFSNYLEIGNEVIPECDEREQEKRLSGYLRDTSRIQMDSLIPFNCYDGKILQTIDQVDTSIDGEILSVFSKDGSVIEKGVDAFKGQDFEVKTIYVLYKSSDKTAKLAEFAIKCRVWDFFRPITAVEKIRETQLEEPSTSHLASAIVGLIDSNLKIFHNNFLLSLPCETLAVESKTSLTKLEEVIRMKVAEGRLFLFDRQNKVQEIKLQNPSAVNAQEEAIPASTNLSCEDILNFIHQKKHVEYKMSTRGQNPLVWNDNPENKATYESKLVNLVASDSVEFTLLTKEKHIKNGVFNFKFKFLSKPGKKIVSEAQEEEAQTTPSPPIPNSLEKSEIDKYIPLKLTYKSFLDFNSASLLGSILFEGKQFYQGKKSSFNIMVFESQYELSMKVKQLVMTNKTRADFDRPEFGLIYSFNTTGVCNKLDARTLNNEEAYKKWLAQKTSRIEKWEEYEPVGFFHLKTDDQTIAIDHVREAKYLCLLLSFDPLSKRKDFTLNFLGAKGTVLTRTPSFFASYEKNTEEKINTGFELVIKNQENVICQKKIFVTENSRSELNLYNAVVNVNFFEEIKYVKCVIKNSEEQKFDLDQVSLQIIKCGSNSENGLREIFEDRTKLVQLLKLQNLKVVNPNESVEEKHRIFELLSELVTNFDYKLIFDIHSFIDVDYIIENIILKETHSGLLLNVNSLFEKFNQIEEFVARVFASLAKCIERIEAIHTNKVSLNNFFKLVQQSITNAKAANVSEEMKKLVIRAILKLQEVNTEENKQLRLLDLNYNVFDETSFWNLNTNQKYSQKNQGLDDYFDFDFVSTKLTTHIDIFCDMKREVILDRLLLKFFSVTRHHSDITAFVSLYRVDNVTDSWDYATEKLIFCQELSPSFVLYSNKNARSNSLQFYFEKEYLNAIGYRLGRVKGRYFKVRVNFDSSKWTKSVYKLSKHEIEPLFFGEALPNTEAQSTVLPNLSKNVEAKLSMGETIVDRKSIKNSNVHNEMAQEQENNSETNLADNLKLLRECLNNKPEVGVPSDEERKYMKDISETIRKLREEKEVAQKNASGDKSFNFWLQTIDLAGNLKDLQLALNFEHVKCIFENIFISNIDKKMQEICTKLIKASFLNDDPAKTLEIVKKLLKHLSNKNTIQSIMELGLINVIYQLIHDIPNLPILDLVDYILKKVCKKFDKDCEKGQLFINWTLDLLLKFTSKYAPTTLSAAELEQYINSTAYSLLNVVLWVYEQDKISSQDKSFLSEKTIKLFNQIFKQNMATLGNSLIIEKPIIEMLLIRSLKLQSFKSLESVLTSFSSVAGSRLIANSKELVQLYSDLINQLVSYLKDDAHTNNLATVLAGEPVNEAVSLDFLSMLIKNTVILGNTLTSTAPEEKTEEEGKTLQRKRTVNINPDDNTVVQSASVSSQTKERAEDEVFSSATIKDIIFLYSKKAQGGNGSIGLFIEISKLIFTKNVSREYILTFLELYNSHSLPEKSLITNDLITVTQEHFDSYKRVKPEEENPGQKEFASNLLDALVEITSKNGLPKLDDEMFKYLLYCQEMVLGAESKKGIKGAYKTLASNLNQTVLFNILSFTCQELNRSCNWGGPDGYDSLEKEKIVYLDVVVNFLLLLTLSVSSSKTVSLNDIVSNIKSFSTAKITEAIQNLLEWTIFNSMPTAKKSPAMDRLVKITALLETVTVALASNSETSKILLRKMFDLINEIHKQIIPRIQKNEIHWIGMNVIHNLFHYLEHVIELTLVDNHMITFFTLECKGIHMIFDLLNVSYEDTSASAADKVVGQSVLAQITKLTPKVVETIQEKPALVTVTPTTSKTAMPQMTPTQPLIGMNPIPFGMPTPNLSIAPLFGNSPTLQAPKPMPVTQPLPAQTTVTPTVTTTAVAPTDLSQLLSKNNIPMNNPDKYSEEFAKDMKCLNKLNGKDEKTTDWQKNKKQGGKHLFAYQMQNDFTKNNKELILDFKMVGPVDLRTIKAAFLSQYNDYGPKIVGEPSYINIHYKARESDAWSFLSTLDVFEDNGFYIGGNVCYQKNYLRMSGDTLAERISSMCIPKRIEYLRFLIGRPLISFQENYSQLKAKDYELPNLAPSFISILGINSNNYNLQIQNNYLKETSLLKLIQKIFSKDFKSLDALANQPELIEKFKIIFDRLIEEFVELFTAPLVSFSKNNPEFGLWVITKLLDLKYKEEHAKVVGEIVISCAEHYSDRMSLLLQFILREVGLFNDGKKPHNKRLFDYMTVFASCVHRGPRATADLKASCVLPLGQDEFNSLIEYYMKMSYVQQIKNFFITLVHLPNNTFKILIDRPMDYMMQLLSDRITQQDQFVLAELLSLIVISKQEYSTIILSKKAIKDEMQPENNGIVDFLMQKLANLGGKDKISVLLFFRNIINHEACKQVIEDKKFPLVVFEELKSYLKQIKTNEKAETNIILMLDIIKFVISTSHNTAVEFAQVLFNYCQEIMKSPEDDMSFMGKIFFPILSTIKTYRVCFSRKMAVKYATDMDETTQKSETEGQKTFNSEFMVQDSLPTLYSNVETLTDSSICDKFKNGKWECVVKSMGSGSDLSQQIEDNLLGKGTFLIVIDGESNNIEYTLGVFCSGGLPKDPSMAKGSRDITIPNSDNDFLFLYEKAGKQNTFHYRTKTSQDVENNFIKYTDKGEGADKGIIVYYQNMEKVFLSFTDATTSHIDLYPMKCLETDPVPNFEFPYDFHIKRGVEIWRLSVPDASAQGQQKKNSNLISMGPLDFKNEILNISYSYYRINTVYNIPSNISLKNLRKAFFADETVSFKYLGAETPIDAEKTFEEIKAENVPKDELEIIDLEYDQDIDIKEVNLNDLRDLYSPQIMILEEFNKIEGMEFIMKFCLNIVKTSAEWVDKPYASNWEQIIKEIQLFSKIDNFIATFTRNPDSIQIILKIFSKSNIPEAQWKTNEEIILSNIYTAVGNLYKFDKSSKIRNQAVEEGIFQMILERLQTISKETSRKFVEAVEEKEEKVDIKEKPSEKKDASKVVQRKGVGYEGVVTTNWSTEEFFKLNEAKNKKIKSMLYIILNILELENWEAPEGILRTVSESCILPLMENAFRCSSLLEMAKEKELYELYLDTCVAISKIEPLIGSLLKLDERYQPQQTSSIEHLLQQLSSSSHIFKKLATGDQKATNDPNSIAFQLAEKIIKCYDSIKEKLVDSKAYNEQMMNEFKNIKDMPMEKAYKLLLAEQRFGYTNMKSPTDPNTYIHHWKSLFTGKYAPQPTKMVRLAQEIADISNSLPIDSTNAMFVRADEERLDVMKSVIFGAEGSPYAHGAFEYDIFFENDYPNIAPKVNLETTGNGDVRFNPNLYACGKVCLSLLGTWRGNASESWDPKISTLSQVLVSIQAVVMSEEVYFNEPGHGHEAGTEGGELKNTAYANIVKLCNIKYAMTGQIENPSKGFENAIRCHFVLKKDKVLETVEKWKKLAGEEEATYIGLVADHNHSYCDRFKNKSTAYLEEITAAIDKLKLALDKLEMPPIEALLGSKVSGGKLKKEKKADIAITDGQANISEIDMTYDDTIQLKSMENDEAGVKDRWSRYIGVMGMESVTKQANAEVLISGMNSLGIEVAKNVILSGLKRLSIHDAKTTDLKDLSGQFFLSEADVGKNRASACINKLAQLNTYVKVDLVGNEKQIPTDEKELETLGFKDYDVVVLIDTPHEVIAGVSNFCRQHDIKLIVADCHGIFSRVFNDFGPKFTCFDKNGEEAQEVMVSSITVEEVGKVTLLEGVKHTLEDGDTIILRGVEGMLFTEEAAKQLKEGEKVPESVNGLLFKVKVINFNSFTIGDTRGFSPYVRGGLAKQIKLPIEMEFKPYNEVYDTAKPLYEPNLEIHDFMKVGHSQILHLAYLALNLFYAANKRLPDAYSLADAKSFYEIALKKNTDLAQFIKLEESEKLLKKLLYMFSMTAQGNFSPQSAYIGGVVCQEIIKAITGKFSPIKQTFYADSLEILCEAIFVDNMHELEQKDFDALVSQAGVLPKNDRDDGLRLLVGENLLDKIKYTNLFMVGSGAIGCELLKNYAMIGLGTGKVDEKHTKSGKIVLTDPDVIELSNLNRQFLFREKHLRKPKSVTAAAAAQMMNPQLQGNLLARLDKVHEGTSNIFTDKFFEEMNIVTNALDNVQARKYIDQRCVSARTPLIESGTLGPKGHVQVIIPNKTESYGSMKDPVEELDIPFCTLKMFPEETLHCVEWARDLFGSLFTLKPQALRKCLTDLKDGKLNAGEIKALKDALDMLKNTPKNFEDCIAWARNRFQKYVHYDIRQLMHVYPLDSKDKEGSPFWKLPKRPPTHLDFDPANKLHQDFVIAAACLRAKVFQIELPKTIREEKYKEEVGQTAAKVVMPEFKPSEEKAKEISKDIEKQNKKPTEMEEAPQPAPEEKVETFDDLKNEFISKAEKLTAELITPEEFEKDCDTNYHIDFIYSLANLRASNYKLDPMDWMTVKIKAGRIVPALGTTTASIAGLQTLELVKVLKEIKVADIKNAFLNLAVPILTQSEPGEAPKIKLTETLSVTLWDRWEIEDCSEKTFNDVFKHIEEKYGVFPRDVMQGAKSIYMKALGGDKILKTKLIDTFEVKKGDTEDLTITCSKTAEDKTVFDVVPIVRLHF